VLQPFPCDVIYTCVRTQEAAINSPTHNLNIPAGCARGVRHPLGAAGRARHPPPEAGAPQTLAGVMKDWRRELACSGCAQFGCTKPPFRRFATTSRFPSGDMSFSTRRLVVLSDPTKSCFSTAAGRPVLGGRLRAGGPRFRGRLLRLCRHRREVRTSNCTQRKTALALQRSRALTISSDAYHAS